MRHLMWFSVGFTAAMALCAYLLPGQMLPVLAAAASLLAGLCWVISRHMEKKAVLSLLLLGMMGGFLWFWGFDALYYLQARELDGRTVSATFTAQGVAEPAKYGVMVDAEAVWQGRTYRTRVYVNDPANILPGTEISGTFRLRITNEGGQDEATFHRGNGLTLLAYPRGAVALKLGDPAQPQYLPVMIRQKLLGVLENSFPENTAAFARALLLGDGSGIDYETNTALKLSGIRHIIAVSGLHVSILFGFIYLVTGKRRFLTALVGIPCLVFFAAVAGFTPSITRACIMQGLVMLALLFEREYDPPTALAFAVLTMELFNPMVVTSISFQLSVGSMTGIFLFSGKIRDWLLDDRCLGHSRDRSFLGRIVRGFAGSLSVSLGALAVTTPLSALYFGNVSIIGPLTNLLTLPVVTVAFYGVMAVAVLGLFWSWGASALAALVSWPMRYILLCAETLSSIPLAAVYTCSGWIVVWLVVSYALIALLMLMRRKRPVILACVSTCVLCAALLLSWLMPMQDQVRMTVLDVGQGQSIIFQTGNRTFLVDCGGSNSEIAADTAAERLLSMGISRIDGVILTHFDEDHAGGIRYFLSRVDADALYVPAWEELPEYLEELPGVMPVENITALRFAETTITVIPSDFRDSRNESSLCVLFQSGNCDILITGDRGSLGEKLLMRDIELPQLDVLVVGHHGARDAATVELLEQTMPSVAVISVEADNRYGHPAREVLDRLEEIGCTVYRTDRDGTVIIRR